MSYNDNKAKEDRKMATTKKSVLDRLSVAEARAALEAAVKREKRETEARNKAFIRLSAAKQRVVIAQDVLQQLALKRLVPTYGKYLESTDDVDDKFESEDEDLEINEVLAGASCHVCGIGSLFVAAVDRADDCTVGDMGSLDNDTFMRRYLGDWFTQKQLQMIETAFEGRVVTEFHDMDHIDVSKSIAFTKRVETATGRLKKIMRNIIDNGGEFRP